MLKFDFKNKHKSVWLLNKDIANFRKEEPTASGPHYCSLK